MPNGKTLIVNLNILENTLNTNLVGILLYKIVETQ